MKLGKWDSILVAIYVHFHDLQYLTQVSLKWQVKKKPQEDGRGEEFGTAYIIGGEVGSIPPYPHQAPKSYFATIYQLSFFLINF